MELEEMLELFSKHDDEHLEFEKIEKPAHRRPDLCAFIMLDSIVDKKNRAGGYSSMVDAAEHDIIYLGIDLEDLAEVVTEEQIRDLIRCGCMVDEENNCLSMFV